MAERLHDRTQHRVNLVFRLEAANEILEEWLDVIGIEDSGGCGGREKRGREGREVKERLNKFRRTKWTPGRMNRVEE